MRKWNLKKVALILFTVACTSGVLTGFSVYMAWKSNPNFAKELLAGLGGKATGGKDFQENADENLNGIKKILIKSMGGDTDFQSYDGAALKIDYSGKIPKSVTASLIRVERSDDATIQVSLEAPHANSNISFNWNNSREGINLSDVSLRAKIYIPKNFIGTLAIQNLNGDIHLFEIQAAKIEIESSNGHIELQDVKSESLNVTMTNGDFDSEGSRIKNWKLENINGDLSLDLPEDLVYQFTLNTTNGSITNSITAKDPADVKLLGSIDANTVSGDIKIKKYEKNEDHDDRD